MRFGFHISIAGGFKDVVRRARACGCQTIQLFSRNPRGWRYRPLDEADCTVFREQVKASDIDPVFIHLPYLPNLGTGKAGLFKKSIDSLIEDLKRTGRLNAGYLIMHVGSSPDAKKGLRQIAEGINRALDRVRNEKILLLENTAGGGHELGFRFEQIQEIIERVGQRQRIGMVLDTAHAFEAGYDLRTEAGVLSTINEIDKTIGLQNLHLIHLNDSKTGFGSRRDQHWHIAKGKIGRGMAFIINHPGLREKPAIMETPRQGIEDDLRNMATVKRLKK